MMRPPGAWSREVDGVDEGVGLLVERVLPGSLAEALGIQAGDVLLRLDDQPLRGADDVARVLRERDPDTPVRVLRLDAEGETDELVWEPGR